MVSTEANYEPLNGSKMGAPWCYEARYGAHIERGKITSTLESELFGENMTSQY